MEQKDLQPTKHQSPPISNPQIQPTVLTGTSSADYATNFLPGVVTSDILQTAMAEQAAQNSTNLQAGAQKEQKAAITQALAQGVKQAANSNQEEYATVARSALQTKLQDLAVIGEQAAYLNAYHNSEQLFGSALAYSQQKGGLFQLEQQGKAIVSQVNQITTLNSSGGANKRTFDLDTLQRRSGIIYAETLQNNKGTLVLAHDRNQSSDSYVVMDTNLDLKSKITGQKDSKTGGELLSDIGNYHDAYTHQQQAIQVLQSQRHMGHSNAVAWQELVTGNFKSLDDKLNIAGRYNNYVRSQQSKIAVVRAADDKFNFDHTIRDFRGTQEDIAKLEKVREELFTEDEWKELKECIDANGYNTYSPDVGGTLAGSASQAKQRMAMGMLDETQSAGANLILRIKRGAQTGQRAAEAIGAFSKQANGSLAERKTAKLIDKVNRSDSYSLTKKQKKAKEKLNKMRNRYGAKDNGELMDKMKKIQKSAKAQRQKKQEIRQATSGMSRTQARIALNRMRNEERMLKHGAYSKRLNKNRLGLEKKLGRQTKRNKAMKHVMPKPANKLANSGLARLVGNITTKIATTIAKLKAALLKKLLLPIGVGILVFILAAAGIAVVAGSLMMFIEDNGNSDESGKAMSDLQIVNQSLSEYEAEQLAKLTDLVENVVVSNYPTYPEQKGIEGAWYAGRISTRGNKVYYDGKWHVIEGYYKSYKKATKEYVACTEAEAKAKSKYWVSITSNTDESIFIQQVKTGAASTAENMNPKVEVILNVVDENGNPASICNCLQLISLYRYYYLYMDGDSEYEKENFWTTEFKDGRMTDAWDATHFVVANPGTKKAHNERWEDGVAYSDISLTGALPSGTTLLGTTYVYTNDFSQSDNCGYFSYYREDGAGEQYIVTEPACFGHLTATVNIQVDTSLEAIAEGEKLKTANGAISWEELQENSAIETMTDLLGTYADNYAQGYELYKEFGIYFGNAKNRMSDTDISEMLEKVEEAWGSPLTEQQTKVLSTAMSGCGLFTYSMAQHENSGKGVTGGQTDCSGFVSWVHNNSDVYSDTGISKVTTGWANAPGAKYQPNFNLNTLPPGSLLIKGDANTASASTGVSNHVVIWLGYLDVDGGGKKPWVIDCSSSVDGTSCRTYNPSHFKSAVPIGSSGVW